ncbi:MAG: metallophosphoesterase family protein [Chloroflexota bacterium]
MRCLVISDIHSNFAALMTIVEDAGSVDAIWCLGDVVGYGPKPNECVEWVKEHCDICLAGNHDAGATNQIDLAPFNTYAAMAAVWTERQLSSLSKEYLLSLSSMVVQDGFTLAHGSPTSPHWRYVQFPDVALEVLESIDTEHCLVGHTHFARVFRQNNNESSVHWIQDETGPISLKDCRIVANPGSVGQPRDGDPRAAYAILDTDNMTWEQRRVAYPVEETQQQMLDAELPTRLIARLSYGW